MSRDNAALHMEDTSPKHPQDGSKVRVLHVATGLHTGGAEMTLRHLCLGLRPRGIESSILSLSSRGRISNELEEVGFHITHLDAPNPRSVARQLPVALYKAKQFRPHLIQGWMYHGNLTASAVGRALNCPVLWNIRSGLHRPDLFKPMTRVIIRVGRVLSSIPAGIIYNSHTSQAQHEAFGYHSQNSIRLPNGVDPLRLTFSAEKRRTLRHNLAVHDSQRIVLCLGRSHPMKGHEFFLRTIRRYFQGRDDVRFLFVGRDASWSNKPFSDYKDLSRSVLLKGESDHVADWFSTADIFVSPSHTESFPNVLAEALAFGLPCVATVVGDSQYLVNNDSLLVPPGDQEALAANINQMLDSSACELASLGAAAKKHMLDNYSHESFLDGYEKLYRQLADSQK